MITIYPHCLKVNEPRHIPLEKAFERIRTGGKHKALIEKIRASKDEKQIEALKKALPAYSFSGKFIYRNDESCIEHSGLICLDFDDTDRSAISSPYIYAAFLSPTGTGVKAIIRIPPVIEEHGMYFDGLREHFNLTSFDKRTRDISRLCFDSYDPDIYINPDAEVFTNKVATAVYTYKEKAPHLRIDSHDRIFDSLERWVNKRQTFTEGFRNTYICDLAGACNRFGIPQPTAEFLMSKYVSGDFTEKEVNRTIQSMYSHKDLFNTEYFEDNQAITYASSSLIKGYSAGQVSDELQQNFKLKPESADSVIKSIQSSVANLTTFWTINKDRPCVHMQTFLLWLQKNGIYRYSLSDDGKWILIQIQNNIVKEVNQTDISHLVLNHLRSLPTTINNFPTGEVIEYFIKNSDRNFSLSVLSYLDSKPINWNRDTKDSAWFYFRNTAVNVTSFGISEVSYIDLEESIWQSQIIDRDFHNNFTDTDLINCEFARFLYHASTGSGTTDASLDHLFQHMVLVTGFMLHGYKDRANPSAIILTDENSIETPEGGTGKGIFMSAIKKFKKSATYDGKSFNFDRAFLWQRVSYDTQIIYIEDVRKNFDFERLFSILTDGIDIEKKNKDSFYIPFEQSPKVCITTNYTLKGDGASNERRRIEVEFKPFYGPDFSPQTHFGHILFDDWDTEQWHVFDAFMVQCTQLYLINGLTKKVSKSMLYKHLLASTSKEFVEFAEDTFKPNLFYSKGDTLKRFCDTFPDFASLKARTFVIWVEKFAKWKGFKFENVRTADSRGFQFKN